MRWLAFLFLLLTGTTFDGTVQSPPFRQDWSDPGLITQNDRWELVPGMVGYRGENLTSAVGGSPDTILLPGDLSGPAAVLANQPDPSVLVTGGVAEFALADPVVALQGSGTADAPHLVLHVTTEGKGNVRVTYRCRDIDGSADNALQPVALQFRTAGSGHFTNVPAAFLSDATRGPSLAGFDTVISVELPPAANDCAGLQLRWITANAAGSDEWVGIDDIEVTAGSLNGAGEGKLPGLIALSSYPNPFNPRTTIRLSLPGRSPVTAGVWDLQGRRVAMLLNEEAGPGTHILNFDGTECAAGIYFCRVKAGTSLLTRKLLLVK